MAKQHTIDDLVKLNDKLNSKRVVGDRIYGEWSVEEASSGILTSKDAETVYDSVLGNENLAITRVRYSVDDAMDFKYEIFKFQIEKWKDEEGEEHVEYKNPSRVLTFEGKQIKNLSALEKLSDTLHDVTNEERLWKLGMEMEKDAYGDDKAQPSPFLYKGGRAENVLRKYN